MTRQPRPRQCRNKQCGETFTPSQRLQSACSIGCAIIVGKEKTQSDASRIAKAARAATRKQIIDLKPRAKWLAEAQTAFNSYIRARDAHLPCVSCGRFHAGAWDAGHYLSVGSMPALRFSEINVHRQCVPCNQHKSGNVLEYRKGLIARIGVELVEWLEGPHEPAKYTIDDAKAIKAEYKAKLKVIQKAGE